MMVFGVTLTALDEALFGVLTAPNSKLQERIVTIRNVAVRTAELLVAFHRFGQCAMHYDSTNLACPVAPNQ